MSKCTHEEHEKYNKLTYIKFDNIYKSKINTDDQLTKPIILKELNDIIFQLFFHH